MMHPRPSPMPQHQHPLCLFGPHHGRRHRPPAFHLNPHLFRRFHSSASAIPDIRAVSRPSPVTQYCHPELSEESGFLPPSPHQFKTQLRYTLDDTRKHHNEASQVSSFDRHLPFSVLLVPFYCPPSCSSFSRWFSSTPSATNH